MKLDKLPDNFDVTKPTPVLCPACFRPTYYALNTDRYVCLEHGVRVTAEALWPRTRLS